MNKLPVNLLVMKVALLTLLGLFVMVLMSCGFMGLVSGMHNGGGAQCGQLLVVPGFITAGGQENMGFYMFVLAIGILLVAAMIKGSLALIHAAKEISYGRWKFKQKDEWQLTDYLCMCFRAGVLHGKIYDKRVMTG